MPTPDIRFRIDFAQHYGVGPGKIRLLESIRDSGSLSQAARDLGMAYRHAWLLLESMKLTFKQPITRASVGGKGGGGVLVTEFGNELISTYRLLELEFSKMARVRLRRLSLCVNKARTRLDMPSSPLSRERPRSIVGAGKARQI